MRCGYGPYNGLYSLWKPAGYCDEDLGDLEFDGPPHLKTVKECVKKYKACYKLYKISTFRLFKTCSLCGREFDYYSHRGCCPYCS